MITLNNNSTNSFFNIALEEYLFSNFKNDIFMLWRSEPSVILGKHQNAYREINLEYIHRKGISVIRRISGGGAVYHDLGNLNFTFIQNSIEGKLVDFRKYTQPIVDVLQSLKLDVRFEGRNDLKINSLKISGNAEHTFKNRVLHHGTLLFNSDLDSLRNALKVKEDKYFDKAVRSVPSHVTNISSFLKEELTIEEFKKNIFNHIKFLFPDSEEYMLTSNDLNEIAKLVEKKYNSKAWNFGRIGNYKFINSGTILNFEINIQMIVQEGIIKDLIIISDFFDEFEKEKIIKSLLNNNHDFDIFLEIISNIDFGIKLTVYDLNKLTYLFF
ncbi:MAG: hypothetical protein A2X64_10690 [Ignavibacteria bacterium GWF2_33_9]|nr:MAG: hypothetical protein A2X64_10690 [Ignavibacteria bacterium GWF2_33_9]